MTQEVVIQIRITIPDGATAAMPEVDYQQNGELPGPPPAQVVALEHVCVEHGAMTFHAARTKPDGTNVSARYSCDQKMPDNSYCPTKAVWLKS